MQGSNRRILKPGSNCWRQTRAERLAFIIDGAAYFRAVREALSQARHRVFIIGWDIDTRVRLVREPAHDGMAEGLGDLLHETLQRNRKLHIHVLIWDWAMLYAAERQWLPLYNLQWRRHRRLHFRLDNCCPFGASQHQKIVVIDDKLAFIGGFDLSRDRWDTPAHTPADPRRINTDGNAYRPFHDIQAAVSGKAAAALGELARQRWQLVTGRTVPPCPDGAAVPWPESVATAAEDMDIAFARTAPKFNGNPALREIETLLVNSIAAAEQVIYVENEYLTSERIGDALLRAMKDPEGPDIVLVLPKKTGNWLEQWTMDVLRWRLLRRLREADRHGRLYISYPELAGLGEEYISLHSKLLIVDERLLTLGSANLSNRSMGFDTECNLVVEAGDDSVRRVITDLRHRLLGEHLDVHPGDITAFIENGGSLMAAIDHFRGHERSLQTLDCSVPEFRDSLLPHQRIVDPEKPVSAEEMADLMVPPDERKSTLRQVIPGVITLAVLAALAAAWRWTPLNHWLDTGSLQVLMEQTSRFPLALVAVPAAYVAAGLLSIPLTFLIIVTAIVFGPWTGFLYALGGALLSAACNFALGRWLASDLVRRVAGSRLNRLSEKLAKRGVLTIVTVRLVPIAPFGIVNLVAGASHVGTRDFMLGSAIGLAPGVLAIALFSGQVAETIRKPELGAFAVLAAIAGALVVAGWMLYRWVQNRDREAPSGSGPLRQ